MKISASIYSDSQRELRETISDLVAHQVDMLHVDCNDDLSVFEDIQRIRTWCDLPIDLHIITSTPELYFDHLRSTPVEFVTFQYEDLPANFELPVDIPGKKGLAVITPTSVDAFKSFSHFDFILIMATVPGQSGGKFDPVNFHKIRAFKKKFPNKSIHVDGGVNGEVSFILRTMGVTASVSGSFLFKAASVGQALMDLTKREIHSMFEIRDFMVPLAECPVLELDELSFRAALEAIEYGNLGFAMVEKNGVFQGIISNADVRRLLLQKMDEFYTIDPKELMNRNPRTIGSTNTVNDMLEIVKEASFPIMYLPVISGEGKIEGAVAFFHLIRGEA
jgi:ribulose-phosphate 3-epimerase